jgi:PAS domain S-box-containing protein
MPTEKKENSKETLAPSNSQFINDERFQAILSLSSTVIYTCRLDGDYGATAISENVREQCGYEPTDFTNDPGFWASKIHPDDRLKILEQIPQIFQTGKHTHEYRFLHKNGEYHWMRDDLRLVKGSDGKAIEIIGIWTDLTESKQQDFLFKESQRAARIGSYHSNLVKDFWFGSEVFDDIVGIDANYKKTTQGWIDLIHPEDIPKIERHLAEDVLKQNAPFSMDYRIIRQTDGEVRWVSDLGSTIVDDSGNVVGLIGTLKDITERIEAEQEQQKLLEQLQQKHKMEAVGYMAGGMAHNFNNNLAIILGNIVLSQRKVKNPKVQEHLENAKIATLRSRDLISQIMTYSRRGVHNKSTIKLKTIIDETTTLLRSTLPSTLSLKTSINPTCDAVFINAAASQIQEILINLCNNAVQAMGEKGEITISLELVELNQSEIPSLYDGLPGQYAKLSVQDNGCGITDEMVDKIFDPFFTTKEDYEGAGMGLATVQGIVARHNGVIKVKSIPNKGTAFNLYFPRVEEPTTEPVPINVDMPKGTEKILFVDDDKELAKLGKELLSGMGYQVTMITESIEALKRFNTDPNYFDLVITDLTMPKFTGQDLIQKLKQVRPNLPAILYTGYSRKIDETRAKELGVNALLMKPLNLPELLQAVRRVLDEKRN